MRKSGEAVGASLRLITFAGVEAGSYTVAGLLNTGFDSEAMGEELDFAGAKEASGAVVPV